MCKGFQQNERDLLKIKAFYVYLSFSSQQKALRDSLTLHFLPRINGGPLEINGSNVRPDTPGFVTLHRVVSADTLTRVAMYGSRERLRVSEGLRFEIYASDGKVLKGIFRKMQAEAEAEGENWKLDCKCQVESQRVEFLAEADVCVEVEGRVAVMSEKVEIVEESRRARSRRGKMKRTGRSFQTLEEIPEQSEEADRDFGSDGCCYCSDCDGKVGRLMDGGDCEMEVEMDGVRWAVDVGIWVMCLGVGYLVSKASRRRVRRQRRVF